MRPATEHIRVLTVDDHPMVREGLRSMLSDEQVEVVAEAASAEEALRLVSTGGHDVVLLDLELPDMDGISLLRKIREIDSSLPVLIVTMHQDPALVRRAVQAGATGYVLKGVSRSELLASIRAVGNGESVLDPGLLRAVLDEPPDNGPDRPAPGPELSRIELELLRLVAAGLTNRQIGQHLRWSHATVKKYLQRVLEKLGVSDRTQAAVVAVRRGLLD